ncbi:MAG: tetratricopeptide repeat protein, partial [bacterium]|nr:tetratricopeptide repeat protein [bacterium]
MMRKLLFLVLVSALIALPLLSQNAADKEMSRTMDYVKASQLKGVAKVNAMKAYVKKFPETSSKWTKLAYYQMALEYYILKNFSEAVKGGEKRLKMGGFGPGEEARLNLVLGNSYGIKSSPVFNQAKALKYTNKAITLAKKDKLIDVEKTAKDLKKKLSGPKKPVRTPLQKIKRAYADEEYNEAIKLYKGFSAADKANPDIHETYAKALLKVKKYDSAIKEFKAINAKSKRGIISYRIGDAYAKKAKKGKAHLDNAAYFYVQAGLLYKKEGESGKMKTAFDNAESQLGKKYGYNKMADEVNNVTAVNLGKAKKNAEAIKKAKRELKKHKRRLYRTYESQGMSPPSYEEDTTKALQEKVDALESGTNPAASDGRAKLDALRKKINQELKT